MLPTNCLSVFDHFVGLVQVFSYEFCKNFKNTYFVEHLQTAGSKNERKHQE